MTYTCSAHRAATILQTAGTLHAFDGATMQDDGSFLFPDRSRLIVQNVYEARYVWRPPA
jgi:hypothetical protein